MEKGMTFREKIYELARRIPKGKVATYGQLAKMAGHPGAARAVGLFMKTNPYPASARPKPATVRRRPEVPCHRVVAANGALTGYSAKGGLKKKRAMLAREGVKFKGEKADLRFSLWKGR